MKEQDTVRLLQECDAGVKMGIASIGEMMEYAHSINLKRCLRECKASHEKLEGEIHTLLSAYAKDGKNPNPVMKGMAHMKTSLKLALDGSDRTVASLATDGCHMGIKTLSRYLNEYRLANEKSKDITRSLINQEEKLAYHIRRFL